MSKTEINVWHFLKIRFVRGFLLDILWAYQMEMYGLCIKDAFENCFNIFLMLQIVLNSP